jgi:hypothetical protein
MQELKEFLEREPDVVEKLVILQEECNELSHAVSKIFRFGLKQSHPDRDINNYNEVVKEAGDVYCLLHLLFSEEQLKHYANEKLEKLKVFSSIFS